MVKTYQERGEIGPGDPEEIAKVLLAMWPGFMLQHAVVGDVDARSFAAGLRSLLAGGSLLAGETGAGKARAEGTGAEG